jgi:SpoVK/Ycf46/Vps4 family AAA+-type ATPase
MKNQITNYVRAGYPGLYLVSHEEQRVGSEFKAVVKDLNGSAKADARWSLYAWSFTEGIVNTEDGASIGDTQDPLEMLKAIASIPERSIIMLRDFHMFLAEPNPLLFRMLKDALALAETTNRVLVIVGCQLKLPAELEKEITVVEYKLPDREQLREVIEEVATGAKIKLNGNTEKILDAASGLTTIEAKNAVALSIIESSDISADIISREKANTVKKNGLLEIIEPNIGLDDIGGLENLKRDLSEKRNLFTKDAREYGLPTPRGQLYVGQPGTGKSLCATATGGIFDIPLVKLEAGRIFGSLVGESERNWRAAFATAKAISPCVLWIDEVDGLFSGAESSGKTDGGTTARVVKAILQDMQFNGEGIFFVFTANDIDGLPDPLIDRLDVWSVDLPTSTEREAIWSIHIAKRGRDAKKFKLSEFSEVTDGFSGRQIEQLWLKAMTRAFNSKREPSVKDVIEASKAFVPTSVTMKDAIERRRKRLENRATPASNAEAKVATGPRKLAK